MFHMQCIVLGKSAGLMRPWRFSLSKKAAFKRGEIRKQAKTLISSRFKDSGQTGYK